MMNELDVLRPKMLNALLNTPHRDLGALYPVHAEVVANDPLFYVHLAAWYKKHGAVRDHNEVFVTTLALSQHADLREVGLALLRDLPPHQVARVIDFIKGDVRQKRTLRPGATAIKHEKGKKMQVTREMVDAAYVTTEEKFGLFRNAPRSLRTEVARYLREREADAAWFDRTVLAARRSLRRLYAGLRIKPSARANQILFKGQPPEDSVLYQLSAIQHAATPAEAAELVVRYRIPYRVAVSVMKQMSPTVLAALIDAMTPAEVLNTLASLKERGAMDNADLKALVDGKLKAAKTDKRVAPLKAKQAAAAGEFDEETTAALQEVTQAQVTARGKITRATALLIDKSGSQTQSIEVGKQLAALVSTVCDAPLFVYAFDTVAYPITPNGRALSDWEAQFRHLRAGGGTSCGVALMWMARQKQLVEQIVMITDEDEANSPSFEEGYRAYAAALNVRPSVTLVRIGKTRTLVQEACQRLGVEVNHMDFSGDYYSLPNVINYLTQKSLADVVMEILAYPLPARRRG